MKLLKTFGIVGGMLLLPIFALAQYVPIQNQKILELPFGVYHLTATFNGSVDKNYSQIGMDDAGKTFNLNGASPDATVTFKVTANEGSQSGLFITANDAVTGAPIGGSPFVGQVTLKASELGNVKIGAEGIKQDSWVGDGVARPAASTTLNVKSDAVAQNKTVPFLDPNSGKPQDQPAGQNGGNGSALPAPSAGTGSNGSSGGGSGTTGGGASGTNNALVPCNGAEDCTIPKLLDMGARIYNYLVGLGALVAVGVIILAGFSYIRSAGDAKQMQDAKHKIVLAILGLVFLGASVLLVNTVLKVFQANIGSVESVGGK